VKYRCAECDMMCYLETKKKIKDAWDMECPLGLPSKWFMVTNGKDPSRGAPTWMRPSKE
jgi:hypothetical protein